MSAPVTIHQLLPGMMFLQHIEGFTGRAISAMQGFIRGGSYWTHAGLIVDGGWYIQGQPPGARLYRVEHLFTNGRPLLVSDAPVQFALAQARGRQRHDSELCSFCQQDELELRSAIAYQGRLLRGSDYSFLDYPALGLAEWAHGHPHNQLLNRVSLGLRTYINDHGHLICSALVDRALQNVRCLLAPSGIQLFDDRRMPGDVTPEDLAEFAYMGGRKPLIDTREHVS